MIPLLEIKNLNIRFQSEGQFVQAVEEAHLSIFEGQIAALVGESGSGKSVTALSILQLLPKSVTQYEGGNILFHYNHSTVDLLNTTPDQIRDIRGNKVSMIFQEPMTSLNPLFTCGHQVSESIRLHQAIPQKSAREKTCALFEKVKLPDPAYIYDRYPHELSGGQKQRVMIAMAVSCRPALLLADEPTTALDASVQQSILELIRDLRDEFGMGVLFITHDLGLVKEISDTVSVMYRGRIVEQAETGRIFSQPAHPYTRALIACRTGLLKKEERLPVVTDFLEPAPTIKMEFGRKHGRKEEMISSISQEPAINKPLLAVNDLKVWFPKGKAFFGKATNYIRAVDGVSFDLGYGETLGLVGESGCGKTTLGRTLLRLIEPTGGTIHFGDQDLMKIPSSHLRNLRKNIQIIFQDPFSSLNPRLPIGAALSEPLKVHGIYPSEKVRKEKVIEWLEKVELKADHYYRYPHEFSGGQRQRICIARALILEPGFVVCDESVSALDVSVQAQVLNLLKDLRTELGFSTIFISHDLAVVHYISQRIMVMRNGKIEESGTADQVFNQPKTHYTQKLLDAIPGGKSF